MFTRHWSTFAPWSASSNIFASKNSCQEKSHSVPNLPGELCPHPLKYKYQQAEEELVAIANLAKVER